MRSLKCVRVRARGSDSGSGMFIEPIEVAASALSRSCLLSTRPRSIATPCSWLNIKPCV